MTPLQRATLQLADEQGGHFTFWPTAVTSRQVVNNCVKKGWLEKRDGKPGSAGFGGFSVTEHHITDAGRAALAGSN